MGKGQQHVSQLEDIFTSLPGSVIVCDREEKILRINAAALKLFEVSSEVHWQGISYQQFLQRYKLRDDQQQAITPKQWLMNLIVDQQAVSSLVLYMPSGRKASIELFRSPLLDAQKRLEGTIYVFHDVTDRYQKALHVQAVHQAVVSLIEAIAHIPDPATCSLPKEPPLLSPPVLSINQQLVDVIRQVLDCYAVSLLALDKQGRHFHVTGSGFTTEQELYRQEMRGRYLFSVFFDETMLASLYAKQAVVFSADRLHIPPGYQPELSGVANTTLLMVPLFLEHRFAGSLLIIKAGLDNAYTPEEIELVKVIAEQTELIIECLYHLQMQAEAQTRELMRHEIQCLVDEFLNMAAHELRTPLTAIKGNIQLARRRLAIVKSLEEAKQSERMRKHIEQALEQLESATESTRVQERMINDLIDDVRLQVDQLTLSMTLCDLSALLKEAVIGQQQSLPKHRIVLEIPATVQELPIIADVERIMQVLNVYLTNALISSPAGRPVVVELAVEDAVARVSIRDEGPGIPLEEQEHLWERFYCARGSAVRSGFYLCKAFIERHHGSVGVQSIPGYGATFWFTLPIAR